MSVRPRTRDDWQRMEAQWLAPYACPSASAHCTRRYQESEHAYRAAFQRDRDRIIHSRAFRRLKHKRQVFLITEGDHFRTRLTHTLEVAQISRTIGRALGLNEDLLEAIALGHDLGHTPFGHLGETVLDEILQGNAALSGAAAFGPQGGFKHNYQSLRIVDALEMKYEFPGLNLTAPVREGILKHTRLKRGQIHYHDLDLTGLFFDLDHSTTVEGQVVAIADEVAQRTHDFEDGIRAELVTPDEIRDLEIVQQLEAQTGLRSLLGKSLYLYCNRLISALINLLVSDLIAQSLRTLERFQEEKARHHFVDEDIIHFSPELDAVQNQLNKFIYQRIIFHPEMRKTDEEAGEVLRSLFRVYYEEHALLPTTTSFFAGMLPAMSADERPRRIADFIAGMTDSFAITEFERLQRRGLALPKIDLEALRFPRND